MLFSERCCAMDVFDTSMVDKQLQSCGVDDPNAVGLHTEKKKCASMP
jgi:hypothetical protein